MKFYEYTQNNSGGVMVNTKTLCHRLFIEAENCKEAETKALSLGVYFNGCESGQDCSCCGDRWSKHENEIKLPYRYGTLDLKRAKESGYDYEPTTWKFMGDEPPEKDRYDLIFWKIEDYAKYLKKEYGWVIGKKIDARVFYKNGEVVSI